MEHPLGHCMSKRHWRFRLLPTLPALARIAGVLIAITIGWLTTLGASLFVFYLIWHGLFWGDAYLTAFVLESDPHATLIPTPWVDNARYVDLGAWIAAVMSALGTAVYLLRSLKPAIRRLTAPLKLERVKRDHYLHDVAEQTRRRAGLLSKPSIWLVTTDAPIAFAYSASLGRHAVVISTALVKGLPREGLSFVIAHEFAHIHYRDTTSAAIWLASAQAMQFFVSLRRKGLQTLGRLFGSIPILRDFTVLPLLALTWVLHNLTRFGFAIARGIFLVTDRWVSRHMEYRADAFAAHIVSPVAGVHVLSALDGDAEPLFGGLFATHPPIKHRVARLQAMHSRN